MYLSQQRHEGRGGTLELRVAPGRIGRGGVAADARRMQILRLAAEADPALRRQHCVALL
jgi:hypothetical protein